MFDADIRINDVARDFDLSYPVPTEPIISFKHANDPDLGVMGFESIKHYLAVCSFLRKCSIYFHHAR